ncbi:MAG: hypothetical protein V2A79_14840 [Planctomycetota bacterium]
MTRFHFVWHGLGYLAWPHWRRFSYPRCLLYRWSLDLGFLEIRRWR